MQPMLAMTDWQNNIQRGRIAAMTLGSENSSGGTCSVETLQPGNLETWQAGNLENMESINPGIRDSNSPPPFKVPGTLWICSLMQQNILNKCLNTQSSMSLGAAACWPWCAACRPWCDTLQASCTVHCKAQVFNLSGRAQQCMSHTYM